MGKVCLMILSFVKDIGFYFALATVAKLCGKCPFIMIKQFPIRFEPNNIILFQFIQFEEHLIIIITTIHAEGCFSKECSTLIHCIEGNGICRFIILFCRRMYSGKNADWMITCGKDAGLCNMISFFYTCLSRMCFQSHHARCQVTQIYIRQVLQHHCHRYK